MEVNELKTWFYEEVLPLEPSLMRFIGRHWRVRHDIADIRQDVYARVLEAASRGLPSDTAAYVFTTTKNVLINRARRASVISIEMVADIHDVVPDDDWLTPERHVAGRQALQRLVEGMNNLPPRCREIVRLRKVEGLSTREVAHHLGIGIDAVQQQTMLGMRALTDFMLGGDGRIRRPVKKSGRIKSRLS